MDIYEFRIREIRESYGLHRQIPHRGDKRQRLGFGQEPNGCITRKSSSTDVKLDESTIPFQKSIGRRISASFRLQ